MSLFVEKRTVSFGVRSLGTGTFANDPGSFAGIPSPQFRDAGAVNVPSTLLAQNTRHVTSVPLLASGRQRTKQGPVSAIAISADSPIASVNLVVGEEVFALSPDRPYVGVIDDSVFVGVMPARNTPMVYRLPDSVPTFTQYRDWVVPWDMATVEKIPAGTFSFGVDVAAPKPTVKLDIYRGDVSALPRGARAAYHAEIEASLIKYGAQSETPAVSSLNNPTLLAIVDGRRRWRVTGYQLPTAVTGYTSLSLRIWGIEGFKSTNGLDPAMASNRIDSPMFDELMAKTAMPDNTTGRDGLVFDYSGNPYWGVLIRVLANTVTNDGNRGDAFDANGGKCHVALHAWDD